MERILDVYYSNNARKLHNMVDAILSKFGGISQKDYDDFYSLANEVFVRLYQTYDSGKGNFDGYLYSCLLNKIKSEFTARNRQKRQAERMAVSMDAPLGDEEFSTLADVIIDDFDVEKEVLEKQTGFTDERAEAYLESLNDIQRSIIEMRMEGEEVCHIKEKLGLSEKQYACYMRQATAYEHIRLLNI